MTAGVSARIPALGAIVVVVLLATATLTLAATSTGTPPAPAPEVTSEPETLVVPDVRRQAYVFAKGTLEGAGFAWKVVGPVRGYAANVVVTQTPAPGSRVVAEGAPIIRLGLARNVNYKQEGLPDDVSPFTGRPARLAGAVPAAPAAPKPAAKPKPAAQPKPAAKPKPATVAKAARKPDFAVAGAPAEPADEIALDLRAKRLGTWLETHRRPTKAAVNHWLYQHNWIVTGASFGWAGGAEALKTLIAVDRRVQKLWGMGARSEAVARRALASVERNGS
jgi:hypothetical protein